MQGNYVWLKDICIYMQDDYVHMEDNHVCMQDNYVYISKLKNKHIVGIHNNTILYTT